MARCNRCGKDPCECPAKPELFLFAPDPRLVALIEQLARRVATLEAKCARRPGRKK